MEIFGIIMLIAGALLLIVGLFFKENKHKRVGH